MKKFIWYASTLISVAGIGYFVGYGKSKWDSLSKFDDSFKL